MLLHYNGMLIGNYELFTARAELIEAEHKGIEALRDYWTTRAELERAVGGKLSSSSSSFSFSSSKRVNTPPSDTSKPNPKR